MSQISADTIKGVTAPNNLTLGNTPIVSASANSLTIKGEGSAQTSIQQGLCKAWSHHSGNGSIAAADSFNQGSITDNGSGDNTYTFTNNMANANFSLTLGGGHTGASGSFFSHCIADGLGTSAFRYDTGYTDNTGAFNYEWSEACHQVVGDLA